MSPFFISAKISNGAQPSQTGWSAAEPSADDAALSACLSPAPKAKLTAVRPSFSSSPSPIPSPPARPPSPDHAAPGVAERCRRARAEKGERAAEGERVALRRFAFGV